MKRATILTRIVVSTVILLSTQNLLASVKDKKAVDEGNKQIEEAKTLFKDKCGSDITVNSAHDKAGSLVYPDRDSSNIIGVAGGSCAGYIRSIGGFCEDKDYKDEISKLKTITCVYKKIDKKPYLTVQKSGTSLTMTMDAITSENDFDKIIKNAF